VNDGYAERECHHCTEGRVRLGTPTGSRTEECPACGGTGRVLSYLYPKPKGRRGPWPPQDSVTEGRPNGGKGEEGCG
jgi:hypothetical protein